MTPGAAVGGWREASLRVARGRMAAVARAAFNVAACVSALLFLATAAAWPVSYFRVVRLAVMYLPGVTQAGAVASDGRVMVFHGHATQAGAAFDGGFVDKTPYDFNRHRLVATSREAAVDRGPFAYWRLGEYGARYHRVVAPAWFFLAALAVLPGLWLRRRANARRALDRLTGGRCPGCGYDLAGTAGRGAPAAVVLRANYPECGRTPVDAYNEAV